MPHVQQSNPPRSTSVGPWKVVPLLCSQEIAIDDLLDEPDDPDNWEPKTFILKSGSCVLLLPEGTCTARTPLRACCAPSYLVPAAHMQFSTASTAPT